jgi:hypothetical protein
MFAPKKETTKCDVWRKDERLGKNLLCQVCKNIKITKEEKFSI